MAKCNQLTSLPFKGLKLQGDTRTSVAKTVAWLWHHTESAASNYKEPRVSPLHVMPLPKLWHDVAT